MAHDFFDQTPRRLQAWLATWNEPKYRVNQLMEAAWSGIADWAQATALPLALRKRLQEEFAPPAPAEPAASWTAEDATQKVLFRFADHAEVESVAIPKDDRLTFCISTQAGCAMGCAFCATARLGFRRHLSAGEILAQVRGLAALLGRRPTNLVLMGMGEPLHNLEAVREALEILGLRQAWAWPPRRTVVSTSGWVPGIEDITRQPLRAKLALSLNATRDEERSALMPVNRRYPLKPLLAAVRAYSRATGEQISLEYILIRGINDSVADARRLAAIAKSMHSKINLILYNSTPGLEFRAPDPDAIARFAQELRKAQVLFTQRTSRGAGIGAACGQLAGRTIKAAA